MSLLRVLGRPMLASMFIAGGLDSVRHPDRVSPSPSPSYGPSPAGSPWCPTAPRTPCA